MPRNACTLFFRSVLSVLVVCGTSTAAWACTEHKTDVNDQYTEVRVPGVIGDTEDVATACLQRYGYTPRRGGEVASKRPKGTVVRTQPSEGTTPIQVGAEMFEPIPVVYWVSSGETRVPDVVGMPLALARIRAAMAGFGIGEVSEQPSNRTAGSILSQDPAAGTLAPSGQRLDVVVSIAYRDVPDVIGLREERAIEQLRASGFTGSPQGRLHSPEPAGIVQRTQPAAGTKMPPGDVAYWVASGQNAVPDLLGKTREAAAAAVESAGFRPGEARLRADLGEPHRVVEQNPQASTLADVGTPVSVWISQALVVPDVVGMWEDAAQEALVAAHLQGVKGGEVVSAEPRGRVLSTEPAAGTRILDQQVVRYQLASGSNVVPDLLHRTADEARQALEAEKFALGDITHRPAAGPENLVLQQQPGGGDTAPLGTRVDVILTSGLPIVPDVVGELEERAEQRIREASLKPSRAGAEPTPQPRGTVLRTDPAAGTRQEPDEPVRYWIASGKNRVPNLIGLEHARATSAARAAGFELATLMYTYAPADREKVLVQTPADGELDLGAAIDVTLGSSQQPVPDLKDKSREEAARALEGLGMSLGTITEEYRFAGTGRVVSQDPPHGTVLASAEPVRVSVTIGKGMWPFLASSTGLMVLLAGTWWTQLRTWPWHWPPKIGMRVSLERPTTPWPQLGPMEHDASHDVRIGVALVPGAAQFVTPLPIERMEVRYD